MVGMWLKIKIKKNNKIIEKDFQTASHFLEECEADTDLIFNNEIVNVTYHGEFDMEESDEIQTIEDLYDYFCEVL